MTKHGDMPHAADVDQAFVYAELFGWTCSICAPLSWSKERVEAFAGDTFGTDGWQSVNLVELFGQAHSPTPGPCNKAPAQRQHWFLLRDK
jgi:hypothetical protein